MSQIINIFRKDMRQLWPELQGSLTILVLFTYFEPKSWLLGSSQSVMSPAMRSTILAFLLCMSWEVLLIRLIQLERLVGLNQFWTTRPYEWPKLMAAKALFIAVFLYVPLLLSQLVVLSQSGLPMLFPRSSIQNSARRR